MEKITQLNNVTPVNQETHFKSLMSLSKKFIMLDVNIKLEKTVKRPAIPAKSKQKKYDQHFFSSTLNETRLSFFPKRQQAPK